jgi:hypothetical protein
MALLIMPCCQAFSQGKDNIYSMSRGFDQTRSHERKKYGADIVFAHNERSYYGTLKDLSLGGAFIKTVSVNQFGRGDLITVSIPFTDGEKHLKRNGRVKWKNDEGFAIEFI